MRPRCLAIRVLPLAILAWVASPAAIPTSAGAAGPTSGTRTCTRATATFSGPVTVGHLIEPITAHPLDLSPYGYVQQEFFASGIAHAFRATSTPSDGPWSIVPSPDPSIDMNPSPVNELTGVSCTSSTDCVAVGYDLNGPGDDDLTLIESWNGSVWKVTPSPNNEASDSLSKVSCVNSRRCTAVGGNLFETGY